MASKPRPWPPEPPGVDGATAVAPVLGRDPDRDVVASDEDVLEPIVRTARGVRPDTASRRNGPDLGRAARGATELARHLDVALSRRMGPTVGVAGAPTVTMPWGVWPSRDEASDDDRAAVLGPALASYARLLRTRRGAPPPPPARGIPLVARRGGGTAAGPQRGPGGLARSMVPVDQPIAAPSPIPRPASPRPTEAPSTLAPRRPGGR